ncbi:MAG: transposase [Scytonematopsis contorta HA4267-MV1]|jgi:putative transposase|nr:transposase [Scytonematopsis contorta HA4267-MV1]
MQLTYQYKAYPTKAQVREFESVLELCRRQYNYRLAERFKWFESTRCATDRCDLTQSIVSVEEIYKNIPLERVQKRDGRKKDDLGNPITKKGDVHSNIQNGYVDWNTVQQNDLPNTKKLFSEYKKLHSQVLQNVLERVDSAMNRYINGDKNGKRSGRPKFKGKHYYNSFTYTQMSVNDFSKDETGVNYLELSKLCKVEINVHRAIPEGFSVKTVSVIKKSDGWYLNITLEDKKVPVADVEICPTEKNSIGIDLGLEFYCYLSNGEHVEFPRWLRLSLAKLEKLQQKLAKREKHSIAWCRLKNQIARLHNQIARRRLDWQFKLAYKLFQKADVIFVEDLALKNLIRRVAPKINNEGVYLPNNQSAKSGLNLSLSDAALSQFIKCLDWVAYKLGKRVIKIDARGTSQYCNKCFTKVGKELSNRHHDCQCGESIPRDYNSAKLIKSIGLLTYDIYSGGGQSSLKNALEVLKQAATS